MKKVLSLIKATMSSNMYIFKIKTKSNNAIVQKAFPVIIALILMFSIGSYAELIIEQLMESHLEFIMLTLFATMTSIMTLVQGIYKSGNLLFDCKDDNLLFSLPIKKSTVLSIRLFKFYIYETLYNSLFMLPAMVVYAYRVNVDWSFYISSIIGIICLPIIPIVLSSIIGGIVSGLSTKFKMKNIAQTLMTTIVLLGVLYISFNLEGIINNIAENATSINDMMARIYYPVGAYIGLVTSFNFNDLLTFIAINILCYIITITLFAKLYFKINSNIKSEKRNEKNKKYKIKANSPMKSLIKKELNKFINTPVFITNAGFGLVLYVIICCMIGTKIENAIGYMQTQGIDISNIQFDKYMPVILFGLICFGSLMSSITSSMISLEGKSINLIKSLPIKTLKIIWSKVLTAVIIMIPFILLGDAIVILKYKFNMIEISTLLCSSIVLPFVAEILGILVNLKYPKIDAENDTEVVKQSMSSMISVTLGMLLLGVTIAVLVKCLNANIAIDLIITGGLAVYIIIGVILSILLKNKGENYFNSINI